MNLFKLAGQDRNTPWNLTDIRLLYPPDNFVGSFSNPKMQARHEQLQEGKITALLTALRQETSPAKAMRLLHQNDQLTFFRHNLDAFRTDGSLEKTLLELYRKDNSPFSAGGDYELWLALFRQADPPRLAACGQPFPYPRATGYRGSVTGSVKGFSWTLSPDEAAWFFARWRNKAEGGGTIFALEINPEDVLAYLRDGRREEVLLVPELAARGPGRVVEELL